jgi:hypothetical protein
MSARRNSGSRWLAAPQMEWSCRSSEKLATGALDGALEVHSPSQPRPPQRSFFRTPDQVVQANSEYRESRKKGSVT